MSCCVCQRIYCNVRRLEYQCMSTNLPKYVDRNALERDLQVLQRALTNRIPLSEHMDSVATSNYHWRVHKKYRHIPKLFQFISKTFKYAVHQRSQSRAECQCEPLLQIMSISVPRTTGRSSLMRTRTWIASIHRHSSIRIAIQYNQTALTFISLKNNFLRDNCVAFFWVDCSRKSYCKF